MLNLALFFLVTLGPPVIPSTPALEPASPNDVVAIATDERVPMLSAPEGGFLVAYGSPHGFSLVHVYEDGRTWPDHTGLRVSEPAFVGNVANELIAFSDATGPGFLRTDGVTSRIVIKPYLPARVAWNGRQYLFAWNDGGTITGMLLSARGEHPWGWELKIASGAAFLFSIASSGDGFLVATLHAGGVVTVTPVSAAGVPGSPAILDTNETNFFARQNLAATGNGYLLGWMNKIAALDRNGNVRAITTPFPEGETLAAITEGAYAVGNRGTLLALDANANVLTSAKVPAMINPWLATSKQSVLVVGRNGFSLADRPTLHATPLQPIATIAIPQSAPLIATADDGTTLASWEVPSSRRRLGRVRGDTPIDGEGIALEGLGAAIGTNGRDFLVATGGTSLSIAYLGTSGPMSTPRVIDIAIDHPDSIIWNGRNYVVFFTRWTPVQSSACGAWREQIYAATIHDDLRSATIELVDLGEGSQKNAKAVKTSDGIALAYSPAHAIAEAGAFTVICRDTTDVALAMLDDQFRVRSSRVLSARGPRDDETPIDVVTDGTSTIVTWSLVLDPHNDGTRTLHNTTGQPIAGAVWTGSRIALIDPSSLPGVDSIVTARGTLAYIIPSYLFDAGDSQVMVVRRVSDEPPPRPRPSR